jgi:GNAT superfamily N-acetyltransferase
MKIEYRHDYFADPAALARFEDCAREVFGLDFSRWKARGLWDPAYIAFSAFHEDRCVASLCVYPSEMIINGRTRRGAQLLTVGTLPEFRKKGIQRRLWEQARSWIETRCDFTFLFTDDSAAGFYDSLGFTRVAEFIETITLPDDVNVAREGIRKLDPAQDGDYQKIEALARTREVISLRIGFCNPNLLLFMYLYAYPSMTFLLEDLDTVVVAEDKGDRMWIHDVMAASMPRLSDLTAFLACFGKKEVEFLFCTDRLDAGETGRTAETESLLFIHGNFDLEGEFIFPSSIRA